MSRRDALRGLLLGGAASTLPTGAAAFKDSQGTFTAASGGEPVSLALSNGLRIHCLTKRSGYVSASLVLRSKEIGEPGGLAHLMEHTSFSGAAGAFSANEIRQIRQDCMQDSDATTAIGSIQWNASFLPSNMARALEMLAITSLDQKFDVETVEREARIVLQELYLIKYEATGKAKQEFDQALYGRSHPYARDTVETEILKAMMPPRRLALELEAFAHSVRLPANMDLFLVGDFEASEAFDLASRYFGSFRYGEGPMLELPSAPVTRSYSALSAPSADLKRPLSELRIAWNTGIRITDPESKVLLALAGCLNGALFQELRDRSGDAYTPEAVYDCDRSSGIFEILVTSSRSPVAIEARVFETMAKLKRRIDPLELARFRDRFELMRRKKAECNDTILESMVNRTLNGASIYDFDVTSIAAEDVLAAARQHLPWHRGAYVRLALMGR
ncbi:MAG TPA: pitrilysin family protein [Hyphomicrobiaceae bacterium]|nr:pitrilysin family protein [Hyphomicrobiaceae bacterium]